MEPIVALEIGTSRVRVFVGEAREDGVKVARLQFDVLRWRAARLAPKSYREEDEPREGGLEVYLQDFTSGAILAPTRWGRWIQSAVFQLLIRSRPHSFRTAVSRRAGTLRGSTPSELPSR